MPGLSELLHDEGFALGQRLQIWGGSCSGKSTLADYVSQTLDMPLVELDALNWLPNWTDLSKTDPERFTERVRSATEGDRWVVAGGYTSFSVPTFWPRLDTLVWLDLPLPLRVQRLLTRTWRRWRTKEHLWGTNYEQFWPMLAVWNREDSLLYWVVRQSIVTPRRLCDLVVEPAHGHIQFIRLASRQDVADFQALLRNHKDRLVK